MFHLQPCATKTTSFNVCTGTLTSKRCHCKGLTRKLNSQFIGQINFLESLILFFKSLRLKFQKQIQLDLFFCLKRILRLRPEIVEFRDKRFFSFQSIVFQEKISAKLAPTRILKSLFSLSLPGCLAINILLHDRSSQLPSASWLEGHQSIFRIMLF